MVDGWCAMDDMMDVWVWSREPNCEVVLANVDGQEQAVMLTLQGVCEGLNLFLLQSFHLEHTLPVRMFVVLLLAFVRILLHYTNPC